MREIFKSGSVGRAPGNRCLYLEADRGKRRGNLSVSKARSAYNSRYAPKINNNSPHTHNLPTVALGAIIYQ
jgi:hypothetical protein